MYGEVGQVGSGVTAASRPRAEPRRGQPFDDALRFASGHADLVTLLVFACLLYFYLRLFRNALIDDAFITLDYVRNLLRSGTWGFFPGHVANTATSPLNVILLALTSLLAGSIVESPIWLALVCFVVMAIALDRISLHLFGLKRFGRLATLAFVFNPLLISTIGLESILFSCLLVLSIYCVVTRKWFWLAFVLGLLSITRADGLLFALIFMFVVPTAKTRLQFLGILLITVAPWYLFSWVRLGSLVPDSLIIRVTQTAWQGGTFLHGPAIYYGKYPAETLLAFAYLAFLPALLFRRVRDSAVIRLLLAVGIAHFLAYSTLAVPPFHWYYAPEVAVLILFGSLALGTAVSGRDWRRWGTLAAHAVVVLAFVVPVAGMYTLLARDHFRVTEVPIHTNLASAEQYQKVGLSVKGTVARKTVLMEGEIGTLAYYCDCYLLDAFSDRHWLTEGVHEVLAGPGPIAALFRINFLFLREQASFPAYSYLLTVRADPAGTTFPHLQEWQTSTRWLPHNWIVLSQF